MVHSCCAILLIPSLVGADVIRDEQRGFGPCHGDLPRIQGWRWRTKLSDPWSGRSLQRTQYQADLDGFDGFLVSKRERFHWSKCRLWHVTWRPWQQWQQWQWYDGIFRRNRSSKTPWPLMLRFTLRIPPTPQSHGGSDGIIAVMSPGSRAILKKSLVTPWYWWPSFCWNCLNALCWWCLDEVLNGMNGLNGLNGK